MYLQNGNVSEDSAARFVRQEFLIVKFQVLCVHFVSDLAIEVTIIFKTTFMYLWKKISVEYKTRCTWHLSRTELFLIAVVPYPKTYKYPFF